MGDSYRPDYGPDRDSGSRSYGPRTPMYHFQGDRPARSNDSHRPPRDFTFRSSRPKIAERPLLTMRQSSPEDLSITAPGDTALKFRDIEQITDSEAEEMDVSDDEIEGAPTKRLRLGPASDEKSLLKWSNPDPYTALPAPSAEDNARKRTDVVKLIRKSRVATSSSENADAVQTNEDFISFDFGDGDSQGRTGAEPPLNAPAGPRGMADTSLGKRKRPAEDEGTQLIRMRGVTFYGDAAIIQQWRPTGVQDPAPWYRGSVIHGLQQPLMNLHTEILDFYSWVKPLDYEHVVRSELIGRLHSVLQRLEPGSELLPFGSFAAGLYLPTADMDLVLLSRDFIASKRRGGLALLAKKPNSFYYKIGKLLERANIPTDRCVVIAKARVPIVKFVDRVSGIKVDLSFDSDTGVNANDTFQLWKGQYPAMPIIVSLIKQYLMIRGLNDNAAGGLGGFSTICLVTSLIQHLPLTGGPPNLGSILVEFFNFYGNLFNRREIGIRMEPPGYFEKRSYKPFVFNPSKADRLSIIDPNRYDNDISGGSQHVDIIFRAFASAYQKLKNRMEAEMHGLPVPSSVLGELIGGNYAHYAMQRDQLRSVFESTRTGPHAFHAVPPPPPSLPPPRAEVRPPPPLPTTGSGSVAMQLPADFPKPPPGLVDSLAPTTSALTPMIGPKPGPQNPKPVPKIAEAAKEPTGLARPSGTAGQVLDKQKSDREKTNHPRKAETNTKTIEDLLNTGSNAKERRAHRLKILRPDLSDVPASMTTDQALRIGGYADSASMTEDLIHRQAAMTSMKKKKKASAINFPELIEVRKALEALIAQGKLPPDAPETVGKFYSTAIEISDGSEQDGESTKKSKGRSQHRGKQSKQAKNVGKKGSHQVKQR